MEERSRATGVVRILWSSVVGFGLILGLLWALMPRMAAKAQDVNPGFTVDLAYDAVWGLVSPGDVVTITRTTGVAPYGAAEADGVGFFWTPLWQSDGQPADIVGGDTIEIYVNGALAVSLQPLDITGQVDVLNDRVVGTISGDTGGTPVTVTLGMWASPANLVGTPQAVAFTGGSGAFTATFSTFDLGPYHYARVEYRAGTDTVQTYLYPDEVFHVDTFVGVFGHAAPGQVVTVTLVRGGLPLTPTTAVAERPHGSYWVDATVEPNDEVQVDLGGGTVITTVASNLTAYPDATLDQVTGTCPPNEVVRVWAWDWRLGTYAETSTVADPSGRYTATFAGYDLKASDMVYPSFADGEGDEVLLSTGPPHIGVSPYPWEDVWGKVDGPNLPVTVTLNTGTGILSATTSSNAGNSFPWTYFGDPPEDIQPGHVVTVESPTWVGVMTVADLGFEFDTASDRIVGDADIPGWVSALVRQWRSEAYPVHGQAGVSTTVSSPFTITFTEFDLRDSGMATIHHYDANDFATVIAQELRRFEVHFPWGVWMPQFSDTDVLTATLYESDGVTIKYQTSEDRDDDPGVYWLDMEGKIVRGDWVTVTDGAGWTAGLQVPDLTIQADESADMIWGQGPQSLLHVEREWKDGWAQQFVPGDAYALDTAFFDHDLQWGDVAVTTYQAANGNLVRRWYQWPQIIAHYDVDGWSEVWGNHPISGGSVYVTVTHPVSGVIATGATTAGACSWCGPNQYAVEFPNSTVVPNVTVTVDFGDGLVDSMTVLDIGAEVNADTDVVTVTAPVSTPVFMNAGGPSGWWDSDEQIIGGSGTVTFNLGAEGYDIVPGTGFNVHSRQYHDHNTQYSFRLAAPDVRVAKWHPAGYARPGGVVVYAIYYKNEGDAVAEGVQIVDTLPMSTTYAGDTSSVMPTVGASTIAWTLGDLAPGDEGAFMVTLDVPGDMPTGTGVITSNCALISTATPGDYNPDNDEACAGPVDVWDDDVEIDVDKWVFPSDPTPGQEFHYTVRWCNNRGAAVGPVWLTDTLPLSTTFVSWSPQNWWEVFWTEVVTTGGQVVLYAPGLPGHWCEHLDLTLLLDADVPVSTTLENNVVLHTPDEFETWNNERTNGDAHVGEPRYDMHINKGWHAGQLTSGGWVNYSYCYSNDGNMETYVQITDTVPAGLSFDHAYWGGGQPEENPPSPTINGNKLIWDWGLVAVGENECFHVQMNIGDGVAPGTTLTNCVIVGIDGDEDWPDNNTDCASVLVNDHGPNLRVTKSHWWESEEQLGYSIQFVNIGDEIIYDVWITDVLPISTTWDGWWSLDFDAERLATYTESNTMLRWNFSELHPGDSAGLSFNANLDEPGVLMRWYTNTVEISTPPGDVVPEDNRFDDGAFSGAAQLEVFVKDPNGDPVSAWIELWSDWGGGYHSSGSTPTRPAQFGDLEVGDYWVRAWPLISDRPGLANSEIEQVTIGEGLTSHTLTLQVPNVIGVVETPEGDPLPPAYDRAGFPALYPAAVDFHSLDYSIDLRVATNITGEFGLALPDGEYELRAYPNWRTNLGFTYTRSGWQAFTLPGASVPLNLGYIQLNYPRIWGAVVTPEGERVSTWVSLWSDVGYGDGDDTYWYGQGNWDNKFFSFGGLPVGHYWVRAEPPWTNPEGHGFSDIYEFEVLSNEPLTTTEQITLVLQSANFVGDVLFPTDFPAGAVGCPGCPVEWVDAWVLNEEGSVVEWATTGEDGRFAFSGLAPGVYTVEVSLQSQDYLLVDWTAPEPVTFTVTEPDERDERTLYLQPSLRNKYVRGSVVYGNGSPVLDADADGLGDARVYAYREGSGQSADITTDPTDGSYELALRGGRWRLFVEPTHEAVDWYFDPSLARTVEFTLPATITETRAVTFTVTQADYFQVTGRVETPTGDPPPTDTVWVDLCTDEGSCFGAPVMASGRFTVTALSGAYRAWVSVEAGSSFGPPADNGRPVVVAGAPVDIGTFRLRERTARVSGRVIVASTGDGLGGVTVEAWTDDGDLASAQTTVITGNYALNLVPGYWHAGPALSQDQQESYVVWPPQYRHGYLQDGGTIENVNFFVRPRDGRIQGSVVDEGGNTLTDVEAVVFAELCETSECWIVNEAKVQGGTFELKVAGGFTYTVGIWLPTGGYMPGPDVPVDVYVGSGPPWPEVKIELLEAGTQIHGYLLDGDLSPVEIDASVYGSQPEAGYWVEDALWPGKAPYKYNLYVPTPATESITWTLGLWVDPATGYIADPAHPKYKVVIEPDTTKVPQILYVKRLDTVIVGTITAGGVGAHPVFVFAKGKSGTDSEGLYFEAETDATGAYTIPVLPGSYLVGTYLPPHLAGDYLAPKKQEWDSVADNPVNLAFRPRAGQEVEIIGTLSVSPTSSLPSDAQIFVFGWSEGGDVSEVTSILDSDYRLPATIDTTWHVWAAYEDQASDEYYFSQEEVVRVGSANVADVDLVLEYAGVLPDTKCGSVDPSRFTRLSLPAWGDLPEPLVEIQAGTMPVAGTVKVCATPKVAVAGARSFVGFVYELEARDQTGNLITGKFNKPVRLIFYFVPGAIPGGTDLESLDVVYYSTVRQEWVSLDDVFIDPEDLFATGKIGHFSRVGVRGATLAETEIYLPLVLRNSGS